MTSDEERFWQRVDRTGDCWLWHGHVNTNGYGITGQRQRAHRVSWEMANGPIPKGLLVCHTCDVRNCVNPAHLWLGTPADNSADMLRKHRHHTGVRPRGENHHAAKLTVSQVIEIRQRHVQESTPKKQLAREYGVDPKTIFSLLAGDTWREALNVLD